MFNLFVACFLAGVGLGGGCWIMVALSSLFKGDKRHARRRFIETAAVSIYNARPVSTAKAVELSEHMWEEIEHMWEEE